MKNIDEIKSYLNKILLKWYRGEIEPMDVLESAEGITDDWGVVLYKEDDINSNMFEILETLEWMHVLFITKEDVPEILKFLNSHEDDKKLAWKNWYKYWKSIDWQNRIAILKDNEFYDTTDDIHVKEHFFKEED